MKIPAIAVTADFDKTIDSVNKSQMSNKKSGELEELRQLTKDFESIFVGQMLKAMRDTVHKSGFINGGFGEDIYRSVMDQEFAKVMAETNSSGISDMLFEQLRGNIGKVE